jgi:carbamoyl-phosphate synthase large subunit
VPFVSKATGVSLAQVAARCMAGTSLASQGQTRQVQPSYCSVKEAVLPFAKFPSVDLLLGPEMKSTGEVMGIGRSFPEAFAKAQLGAGLDLPNSGCAFLSVKDRDKSMVVDIGRLLTAQGFSIVATSGTARTLANAGIDCKVVNKVKEGRPHIVDMLKNGDISLIVNTTEGKQSISDSYELRRTALESGVAYSTTVAGGRAMAEAIGELQSLTVNRLQDLHEELRDE